MKQSKRTTCEKCKPFDNSFEFLHDPRAIVTCTDKKSKTQYIYKNQKPDNLTKYRVDNGLICDNEAKCDYLLLNCDKGKAFFIELKGSDLIKAVEQIDRTIDLLKEPIEKFSIHARIILTRVNTVDLKNSKYLKLEKKVKRHNGDLDKKSRIMTETND